MRKGFQRFLTMLLAVAMVFGLSGMTAFAAEPEGEEAAAEGEEAAPIAADEDSYDVKYAVTLWGINQDTDHSGYTLGLTFGPATGTDYRDTYKAHISKTAYNQGGVCIHWMTWDEIATQSRIDPTAFEACLENGCTRSVEINLNDTLLRTSYAGEMDDGDGVSIVKNSIGENYIMWNSADNSSNGWPGSQIRSVLNGKDELTKGYAKYALDESECLFSCLPEDLQNAVVTKAVKSDVVWHSTAAENNETSYDRLWLFSGKEAYVNSGSNYAMIRSQEGDVYQRSELFNITSSNYGQLAGYTEIGAYASFWWLRTLSMNDIQHVRYVAMNGNSSTYVCDQQDVGISFGFCLAGPADKTELLATIEETDPLNGEEYTPRTWAALQDALEAAYAIVDKADATQKEVDDAQEALRDAIDNLAYPADKTALEATLAEVEEAMNSLNKVDYTSASWGALEDAIAAAKDLIEDPNTVQEEADEAQQALIDALNGLEMLAADKSELAAAIEKAESLDSKEYTAASWAVLEEALADAREILENEDVSQSQVNAACDALVTAMDDLKYSPVEAFAVYCAQDDSLTFYTATETTVPTEGGTYEGKSVTTLYMDVDSISASGTGNIPWYDLRDEVTSVVVDDSFIKTQPISLAYWFDGYENAAFSGFENMDTAEVKSMYYTFYDCAALTDLDVSDWDTGKVTTLYGMFRDCASLTSLDMSGWDVSSVLNMNSLFYNCSALTGVGDLSDWDTSLNTTLFGMFTNCSALTGVDLTGWDTSRVVNMSSLFYNCPSLTGVGDLSEWDTSNVTTFYGMFYNCSSLTGVGDLAGWNTENVTTTQYMFRDCSSLTGVGDPSAWNTAQITNMGYMFRNCSSLLNLDISGWDTTGVTTFTNFATGCSALNWVKIGEKTTIFTMGQCVTQQNWYDSQIDGALVSSDYLQDVTAPGQYWTYTGVADKVALKEEIVTTQNEMKSLDKDDYTDASWKALEDALASAETVADNASASQTDVDAAQAALQSAQSGLVKKGDKTELNKAIESAKGLKESDYTAESWKAFQQALNAAEAVANDSNATQSDVDAALKDLQSAQNGLVKKSTSSDSDKNGLYMIEQGKLWGYYKNGKVDTTYTGFASNSSGKWYVVNGYIRFDQNTVAKDATGAIGTKGDWYYVVGSQVQSGYTGVANYKNSNGWWYIKKGKVDFSANTVAKNKNGWWYVTGGQVQFGYTGVANYKNENGWWYIKGGAVDFSANTVAKNKNGWWYVTGGKVRFDYSGLANYKNASGWWAIKDGKVNFSFNGVASNKYGTWYLKGGKVDFSYSGTVTTSGGTRHTVKNGKIS